MSAFLGITTMLNWMMAVDGFCELRPVEPAQHSIRRRADAGAPWSAALESFPCTLIQGYGQTEGMTMTFLSQEDHATRCAANIPSDLNSCGREGFVTARAGGRPDGRPVPKDGSTQARS